MGKGGGYEFITQKSFFMFMKNFSLMYFLGVRQLYLDIVVYWCEIPFEVSHLLRNR